MTARKLLANRDIMLYRRSSSSVTRASKYKARTTKLAASILTLSSRHYLLYSLKLSHSFSEREMNMITETWAPDITLASQIQIST